MSQDGKQEQVKASSAKSDAQRKATGMLLKNVLIAMGIAMLIALAGVVLGAINYTAGPVIYPGWVLVCWFVSGLLLMLFLVLNIGVYITEVSRVEDSWAIIIPLVLAALVIVGGGGALLYNKHYAWVSAGALLALVVCTITNFVLVVRD